MNMENILGKPSVSFLAILIEPGIGLACKTMFILLPDSVPSVGY